LSRWQSRYKVEIFPHFPAQKIRRLNCAPVQPTVAKLLMDNEKTRAKKKYSNIMHVYTRKKYFRYTTNPKIFKMYLGFFFKTQTVIS